MEQNLASLNWLNALSILYLRPPAPTSRGKYNSPRYEPIYTKISYFPKPDLAKVGTIGLQIPGRERVGLLTALQYNN